MLDVIKELLIILSVWVHILNLSRIKRVWYLLVFWRRLLIANIWDVDYFVVVFPPGNSCIFIIFGTSWVALSNSNWGIILVMNGGLYTYLKLQGSFQFWFWTGCIILTHWGFGYWWFLLNWEQWLIEFWFLTWIVWKSRREFCLTPCSQFCQGG